MEIVLEELSHQINCLKAICKVFDGVEISYSNPSYQNTLIDLEDEQINDNIEKIWKGEIDEDIDPIPKEMRDRVNDGILGIDAKLETGTGKTYIYTRLMYELNQQYG